MMGIRDELFNSLPETIEVGLRHKIIKAVLKDAIIIEEKGDILTVTEITSLKKLLAYLSQLLAYIFSAGPFVSKAIELKPGPHWDSGGTSLKLSNLWLNYKATFSVSAGFAAAAATVTSPLGLILLTAATYYSAESALKINLNSKEATVLWALWKTTGGKGGYVEDNDISERIKTFSKNVKFELTDDEIEDAISRLERVKCIKVHSDTKYELIEKVWVKYK